MGAELSYFFAGGRSFHVFRNLRVKAWNRIANLLQPWWVLDRRCITRGNGLWNDLSFWLPVCIWRRG